MSSIHHAISPTPKLSFTLPSTPWGLKKWKHHILDSLVPNFSSLWYFCCFCLTQTRLLAHLSSLYLDFLVLFPSNLKLGKWSINITSSRLVLQLMPVCHSTQLFGFWLGILGLMRKMMCSSSITLLNLKGILVMILFCSGSLVALPALLYLDLLLR